jgi:hypothetical protein
MFDKSQRSDLTITTQSLKHTPFAGFSFHVALAGSVESNSILGYFAAGADD